MPKLNELVCATNLKNTGFGSCVIDPGKIMGAIRVPKDKVFTQTELDALRATLDAARLAASKSNRIFPIHNFRAVTDNSEDTVYQTLGYGAQVPIRDGNYRWTFQYTDGALCLSLGLRSHNFQSTSWLFYDDKNLILGWRKLDATGAAYGLAGIPATFHANKWKVNDGANVAAYTVYFDMDPQYLNDYLGFVQADFAVSEITGLQNINLVQSGASAAGVIKLLAKTGCDGSNLYDLYSTELAAAAAWTAINMSTGAAITISTVAADPNIKGFTITLDNTDPDYPASGTGQVTINLVDPTALDALDVTGFEGIPITVLRGA